MLSIVIDNTNIKHCKKWYQKLIIFGTMVLVGLLLWQRILKD